MAQRIQPLLGAVLLGFTAAQAQAFNPNEGAEFEAPTKAYHRPTISQYSPAPASSRPPLPITAAQPNAAIPAVAPAYNAAPAAPAYVPPAPLPVTPAPVAPTPVMAATPAPVYVPPPPPPPVVAATPAAGYIAPVSTPYVAPVYAAPAYVPPPMQVADVPPAPAYVANESPPPRQASDSKNRYRLGIEGFRDLYQEPEVELRSHTDYGSITGAWQHYLSRNAYTAIEARISKGDENYKSISGTINGIEDWEYEPRFLLGFNAEQADHALRLFGGLGARSYVDQGKGTVTQLNQYGYDRRILQLYVPIGATYEKKSGGYRYGPTAEIDPVFYGYVNSRLQNLGGASASNIQHSGLGVRADFKVSHVNDAGYGWSFGPFVRYWSFKQSEPDYSAAADNGLPPGYAYFEPKNTRWQYGLALDFLF